MQAHHQFSYEKIASLVRPQSTVLDLGCGTGDLLLYLKEEFGCQGRGVDREESMVLACIQKGLSVFQGNLDEGLRDYPSKSYDYVILSQTLQMLHNPAKTLQEMSRVGKHIIINFPNFGFAVNRLQLLLKGRMPVNKNIPFSWHSTPNIHFCTRKDFISLCSELNLEILKEMCLNSHKKTIRFFPNLLASEVCMLVCEQKEHL